MPGKIAHILLTNGLLISVVETADCPLVPMVTYKQDRAVLVQGKALVFLHNVIPLTYESY